MQIKIVKTGKRTYTLGHTRKGIDVRDTRFSPHCSSWEAEVLFMMEKVNERKQAERIYPGKLRTRS